MVAGYYTLSSLSVRLDDLPDDISKKLPRYPKVPVALLGRLAVDSKYREKELRCGEHLLMDALHRVLQASKQVASFAVLVDALDHAVGFYQHYGFQPLTDAPGRLFLPLATIKPMFQER